MKKSHKGKDLGHHWFYYAVRTILYLPFRLYYHPEILGAKYLPKEGRIVIAGNHKHALDPLLVDICTMRHVHTLAKSELFDGPAGWGFRGLKCVRVDLHAEHNPEAFAESVNYLEHDEVINLSPEAKRNFTDEVLLPFKYGAVVMSQRTGSKIVPYSITGDYRFRSRNLRICFGEPMDVSGMEVEEAQKTLFSRIHDLILQNRDKVHGET